MAVRALSLLLAGSFFWFGGFGRVKEDVRIEDVPIGGMPYAEAEALVRARLSERIPPLTVHSPAGDLVCELCVKDNIASLVRGAARGERLTASYSRNWADAESALLELCARNARPAKDAVMHFSAGGFSYTRGEEGIACDYRATLLAVSAALRTGRTEVNLVLKRFPPAVTEEKLREETLPLASFSTCYDGGNAPRAHNIALAAARVAGTVLLPGEEFSFNRAVGERTEENGFLVANVISDGEFVPGVGGGVCQASTTLFGAALRAGMRITESRAHSLSVGYVPPSLDAMVSTGSDLKFVNPHDHPVYVLASAGKGRVSFFFYGLPDGKRYETESVVLSRIPPPAPEEVEGEEDRVLRAEKEGLKSESYLKVYSADGTLLSRTLIRRDSYAAVRGKKSVAPRAAEGEGAENGEEGAQTEQESAENRRKI